MDELHRPLRTAVACIAFVLVGPSAQAAERKGGVGQANPFLQRQYSCSPFGMSLEELADCGIGILSHFPWSLDMPAIGAFVREAHRHDILLLPYVSPEKAWDDFDAVLKPRNVAGSVPYYRAVSPRENRAWIVVRADGLLQPRYGAYKKADDGTMRPVWDVPPGPGSWYMCANVQGYADAVTRGCRSTLEMGFDGLFIDNAVTSRLMRHGDCRGPHVGKHEHRFPERDNTHAYTQLIHGMAAAIRSFGPEKIVFPNGGLEPAFAGIRDAGMIESYVCGSGQGRWHSWERVQQWARTYQEERRHGRVVTALSYVDGRDFPKDEDTYYCYACTLWSGFVWSGCWGQASRVLYRARLTAPQGERSETDGVHFRNYGHGVVAVNPSTRPLTVRLALGARMAAPVDLFSGHTLPATDTDFEAVLPPESGRVYVERACAMRAYAEEARMLARREARGLATTPAAGEHWAVRDAAHRRGQGEISLIDVDPHTGLLSLQVVCSGNGSEVHASQSVALNQDEPRPIDVSFWARTSGETPAKLALGVRFTDGTNTWWGSKELRSREWTRARNRHTPPRPVAAITLFCCPDYGRTGTAWFDELELRQLDDTGAAGPNLLRDPGFEDAAARREKHEEATGIDAALTRAVEALRDGQAGPSVAAAEAVPHLFRASRNSPLAGRALAAGLGVAASLSLEGDRLSPGGSTVTGTIEIRNGSDRPFSVRRVDVRADECCRITADQTGLPRDCPPDATVSVPLSLSQSQEGRRPYAVVHATVTCTFDGDDEACIPTRATVRLDPALSIEVVDPRLSLLHGRKSPFALRLVNRTGKSLKGRLAVEPPEGFAVTPASVALIVESAGARVADFAASTATAPPKGRIVMRAAFREDARADGDKSLPFVPGAVGAPGAAGRALESADVELFSLPAVVCTQADTAPTLDGSVEERCWETAGRMTDFVRFETAVPVSAATVAYVTRDDNRLYVGVRCRKPRMDLLRASIRPGAANEAQVTGDDCVELYLDPGLTRKQYVRLVVNPLGAHKVSGRAEWEWACGREDDGWVAEVAVSFDSLGGRPLPGTVWGINVARNDHGTRRELSSWAATYETFHDPRTFGDLRFR